MKIAIHKRPGSFSDRWIPYCVENEIPYKIVNCFDYDIIKQIEDCDGLMWHWDLNDYKAALFARQLTHALELMGKKVFPDIKTGWHYEDKVGQKYLLEAIDASLIPSYVFYSKKDAYAWINETVFPKVFKLRTGASSSNVRLVKNKRHAKRLARKAFRNGYARVEPFRRLKERLYKLRRDKDFVTFKLFIGGIARLLIPTELERFAPREKGYVFFQDFLPDNKFDTRIVIVGDRCFGYRRFTRKSDFRASGSGNYSFEPGSIDKNLIKIAFDITDKLEAQSLAFDFVYDKDVPRIAEISYCYCMGTNSVDECPGHWDRKLNWYLEDTKPQKFMIENFINQIKSLNE
jgi:glutathione synthase/RimK-type ligase-like ATP-grasp enzyme